jgi:serine/threonine protein kinase
MAAVWIARLQGEAGFSKLVAIKTMLPHLVEFVEARRMLLDEARVAARIHHPNVVAIQELDEDRGVPYVVMEWVNGLSLDRLIRASRPTAPGIAARIVADACAGLHAAHELLDDAGRSLQVVHRDISPYNVIVSLDGSVKVADFGIVKARGQLHQTTTGDVRGRVSYMAPERVRSAPIDRRADVFAMGATLHEVLTGERAFSGENDAQIIFKIAEASYRPPFESRGSVRDLFAIAARALSRAREDRFATAEEMRLALEAWLANNAPPVITSSSIAEVVREQLGPEIERRQMQLRQALKATADGSRRPASMLRGLEGNAAAPGPAMPGGEVARTPDGSASRRPRAKDSWRKTVSPAARRRVGLRTAAGVALLLAIGATAGALTASAPVRLPVATSPTASVVPPSWKDESPTAAVGASLAAEAGTLQSQPSEASHPVSSSLPSSNSSPPSKRAPIAPMLPVSFPKTGGRHPSSSAVDDAIPRNPY